MLRKSLARFWKPDQGLPSNRKNTRSGLRGLILLSLAVVAFVALSFMPEASREIGLTKNVEAQGGGCTTCPNPSNPSSCWSIQSQPDQFPQPGQMNFSVQINGNSSCDNPPFSFLPVFAEVCSSQSWISNIRSSFPSGNRVVITFDVAPNNSTSPRSGSILVRFQFNPTLATPICQVVPINVSQQGISCLFSLNKSSQSFTSFGGSDTVNVTASNAICSWNANVTQGGAWLTRNTPTGTVTGNGTVSYSLTANTGPQRIGIISIAGSQFTVTQADGCSFSVAPSSATVSGAGGGGSIGVIASNSACPWTASTSASWVSITGGTPGTGSGGITYEAQPNTNSFQRVANFTIAGKSFILTQEAACIYSISPTSATIDGLGATQVINVTASDSGCPWTATSNVPWITFSGTNSGSGNGNVTLIVARNPKTITGRTGTVTVAGRTVTITQNPGPLHASTPGAFRPSTGFTFLKNTLSAGFADLQFFYGESGDVPLAGDWDGDGVDTVGIYRNGIFYLKNTNSAGFADIQIQFGISGDVPIVGDWNGDGIDTIGVVRGNRVLLRNSNTPGFADIDFNFGGSTDIFIVGDWNGDGIDTIGAFRPTNGFVYLRNSNTTGIAEIEFFYGQAGDKPIVGDWNADGMDTIGVFRGNQWLLRNSNSSGFADIAFNYGEETDLPIAGDWDGLP